MVSSRLFLNFRFGNFILFERIKVLNRILCKAIALQLGGAEPQFVKVVVPDLDRYPPFQIAGPGSGSESRCLDAHALILLTWTLPS